MKVEVVINKKTKKPYVTEKGEEYQDFILEVGDIILPQMDRPKYIKADDNRLYPEHRLALKCKSLGREVIKNNAGEDILYCKISQTMYNQLIGLIEKANLNIKSTLFEVVEDKRKSDGKPYKKLKIINPKTPSFDFENFSEDGALIKENE